MNTPATHAPDGTKPEAPPVDTQSPDRFLRRDVQWLEFNGRVLAMSEDDRTPLLERVRFLSIFTANLDEFFMKRIGGLRDTPEDHALRTTIRAMTDRQCDRQAHCWQSSLLPALRDQGISVLQWPELEKEEREEARTWFRSALFPILTPLAVDSGHRFPFISTGSLSLAVALRRPGTDEHLFARVKIPEQPTRMYRFEGTERFILVRDLVTECLDDLFPGMEILHSMPFRLTRDAEIEPDPEDGEDLLHAVEQKLKERRFGRVVRLEVPRGPQQRMLRFLMSELEVRESEVYELDGLLDYRNLDPVADLPRKELHWSSWLPRRPRDLAKSGNDMFARIRRGDVMVHHPYESFDASVSRFISEAASDPSVLAIKQSLYRTSGDSPFVADLIRAAERGKQVAVLVELRARFDEARNIEWAKRLERAGVHVAYGVLGLKTHTKTALVVRKESDGLRCYTHIGTGNYNAKTASLYEDIGLFTCDRVLGDDLVGLFNYMTGRSRQTEFRKLLVAPVAMKQRFLELIEREVALHSSQCPGRIVAKMNQIEDKGIIDALYRASQAGVRIDLIVRGFCCLRPGLPGLSENIRVRSVIGRFLEHSRIFHFGAGKPDPLEGDWYIGSADWMYRNLQTRVEAAAPIELRAHRERLLRILWVELGDARQAWSMHPDGSYRLDEAGDPAWSLGMAPHWSTEIDSSLGTHELLMRDAIAH
ncbi:MAG: polyphosphate kinase 1 [Planctomycetota bacterium]|nr:polyphosphate kinase 1 [Planctomycetota bacterium]MDA1105610.1 polyphosphate kinase 1 [Planctomycetota bacterium]